MAPEEAAHNAHSNRLVGGGRLWHQRACIALRNKLASQRAVDRLQAAIVPTLMSQIIGRMAAKSVDQVWHCSALDIITELNQMLLETRSLAVNLLIAHVEHRQLRGADRNPALGVLRVERRRLAIAVLCP